MYTIYTRLSIIYCRTLILSEHAMKNNMDCLKYNIIFVLQTLIDVLDVRLQQQG